MHGTASSRVALIGDVMTPRSWNGPASYVLLVAGWMTAFALPRAAAAGQDTGSTASVEPAAASIAAGAFASPPSQEKTGTRRKRRDRLKLHWRSASMDYGRKVRLDFRSRMRGELRASDAAITKEALNELDIPRRRVGVDGEILKAVTVTVERQLDRTDPWRDVYVDVTQ